MNEETKIQCKRAWQAANSLMHNTHKYGADIPNAWRHALDAKCEIEIYCESQGVDIINWEMPPGIW